MTFFKDKNRKLILQHRNKIKINSEYFFFAENNTLKMSEAAE